MNQSLTSSVSLDIQASPEAVWTALTDPAKVKKYFFNTDLVTDWQAGKPIYFRGEWEGQSYEDKGTVLDYQPPRMLQYSYWSSFSPLPDEPENYQTITYRLEALEGGATRLTITQENAGDKQAQEHSEQNWMQVMGQMKDMLESGKL